jgi:hypothetical protein
VGTARSCRNVTSEGGVKFPDVTVKLTGRDGNAFTVLGLVTKAMKKKGHGDRLEEFMAEATSGNYGHLLRTCMSWVNVE